MTNSQDNATTARFPTKPCQQPFFQWPPFQQFPFLGGLFGSSSTQAQQISDLQQAVKNIEARLSANSAQSDNNGEKDTQISDENDCESQLSDVSSDENFSDNEGEENGGKTVSFSFKDLVKGDEPSRSGENSHIEKLDNFTLKSWTNCHQILRPRKYMGPKCMITWQIW